MVGTKWQFWIPLLVACHLLPPFFVGGHQCRLTHDMFLLQSVTHLMFLLHTQNVCDGPGKHSCNDVSVGPEKGRSCNDVLLDLKSGVLVTMFLLALKRGVFVMMWVHDTGWDEAHWTNIAPAARVVRVLSESAGTP
jgi:hypothetical protein